MASQQKLNLWSPIPSCHHFSLFSLTSLSPYHRPKIDKPFFQKVNYKIHIDTYKQMAEEINELRCTIWYHLYK